MKKILKIAGVLLIAVAMVMSTVAVTANTIDEQNNIIDASGIHNTEYQGEDISGKYNMEYQRGPILFSQLPFEPDESWVFTTSTTYSSPQYRCFDNYEGVDEEICDIHWWGLSLVNPWAPCDPTGMTFEIIFWDQLPHLGGTEQCIYTDIAPTITPTGQFYSGFEMYYFEADLNPCCFLPDGWVSIQNTFSPNQCWFLWAGSDDGDLYAYQEGSTAPDLDNDMAFELTGMECEPSIDVEKYVLCPCTGEWIDADTEDEALDLPICTDAVFKIVIHNNGECCGALYDINVYDMMHDSLKFISADPEPLEFAYDPPYYHMWWYFQGPLYYCETIEIYITAHVQGPECSIDPNYVEVTAYTECEPGYVFDNDYAFVHAFENKPPTAPVIDGPSSGDVGTEYCWTFHSSDPNGDEVQYVIDWGDGNTETTPCVPSCTPYTVCHTYTSKGDYIITAKAKDCCWGAESPESTFPVTMPRNRAINTPFLNFLQNHPNMFPILRLLLQRLGL